ncbi:MAG: lysine--tRNA ligase [Chloroflexota bacterium]|nr:lysine--tRNA ligase [Chloroflexota bacterium]
MEDNKKIKNEDDRLFLARKNNLEKIIDSGLDPYPKSFPRTHTSIESIRALEGFENESLKESDLEDVKIAGRVVGIRGQGKMIFMDVKDRDGAIQVAAKLDLLLDKFELVKLIDIGDIVGFSGKIFRTRRGEPSIELSDLAMLSKAMRPLPDKWSGLKDVEKRYRQRYLDLISSEDSFNTAIKRAEIVSFIRNFMNEKGYIEVETPVLVDIPAGANARPFSTKHNSLNKDLYLRIATELNLKKLIVGGLEKVYELGRVFRNEGIDHSHNPEFTTIESYEAFVDYNTIMELVEQLVSGAAFKVNGSFEIDYGEAIGVIDLKPPWKRLDLQQAIKDFSGIDFISIKDETELSNQMKNSGIHVEPNSSWATMIDKIISDKVEPNLKQPTFLVDYPVEMSPLAKRKDRNSDVVERFEAFVMGSELANAFTELNDPIDQRNRFEEQESLRKKFNDDELDRLEEDFLIAVEHGMPPTGGLGLGIDRLVMLITKKITIRDVVLFPQLKSLE